MTKKGKKGGMKEANMRTFKGQREANMGTLGPKGKLIYAHSGVRLRNIIAKIVSIRSPGLSPRMVPTNRAISSREKHR